MSIRRRSRAVAFFLSLFVLAAAIWLPTTALAQLMPSGSGGTFLGGTITSPILGADGTAAAPTYSFTSDPNAGLFLTGGQPALSNGSATGLFIDGSNNTVVNALRMNVANGDVGFSRLGAAVAKVTDGAAGSGWIQQAAARSMLAGDYTNATAGFTNTALSITVITGRKYTFSLTLFLIDSTAAEGAQIDFNGGTAAATNFRVHCLHYDQTAAVLKSTQITALASVADSVASTGTGQNMVTCSGSFEPSGTGTFIVRGAQISHASGTLTINRGSNLWVEDMP